MDFSNMSNEEVLSLRNEVNAEANKRIAAITLRDQTRDLAIKAKDLGRSQEEVGAIVESVVSEVFAAPDSEPALETPAGDPDL